MSEPTTTPPAPAIALRTVTVGGLPLLLAGVPGHGPGGELVRTARERGLQPLERISGVDLPRGAELGFVIDREELRLVDPTDTPLLRAAREGLDAAWLEAAMRLKGTMTVLVSDVELTADQSPSELLAVVDGAAADGRAVGAIVGVVEERPQLPLLFG